jgi:nitrite reductase/ring-hydroxylating ferredoxin subunit
MSAPTTAEVKFYPIPGGDYVAMYGRDGVILCRHDDEVYAFRIGCPDPQAGMYIPVRPVPDDQGRTVALECPRHQVRFALNGRWSAGLRAPNLGRMRIWVSQENNNYVAVDTADVVPGDAANREAWQEYRVVLG